MKGPLYIYSLSGYIIRCEGCNYIYLVYILLQLKLHSKVQPYVYYYHTKAHGHLLSCFFDELTIYSITHRRWLS